MSSSTENDFDVAIVGAGAAGLHTAFRLSGDGSPPSCSPSRSIQSMRQGSCFSPRIVVLESSACVGGHVQSTTLDGHVVELGGMCVLPTHRLFRAVHDE